MGAIWDIKNVDDLIEIAETTTDAQLYKNALHAIFAIKYPEKTDFMEAVDIASASWNPEWTSNYLQEIDGEEFESLANAVTFAFVRFDLPVWMWDYFILDREGYVRQIDKRIVVAFSVILGVTDPDKLFDRIFSFFASPRDKEFFREAFGIEIREFKQVIQEMKKEIAKIKLGG